MATLGHRAKFGTNYNYICVPDINENESLYFNRTSNKCFFDILCTRTNCSIQSLFYLHIIHNLSPKGLLHIYDVIIINYSDTGIIMEL